MLLAKAQVGSRIADRDQLGEVVAATAARITVRFEHTAEGKALTKSSQWQRTYRSVDGRSVGCKQITWARIAP